MALELPEALWFFLETSPESIDEMWKRHGLDDDSGAFTTVIERISNLIAPYAMHYGIPMGAARSLYMSGLVAGLEVAHLMQWDPDPGELES